MKPDSHATILLVDDDPAALSLLERWLSADGYKVVTAMNGSEALEVFRQNDPDLVISDLIMPGMGGMDLLQKLRSESPDVQVILVTSYGSIPSAVEAVRAGAFDYLSKPIFVEELRIVAERALEHKALEKEVKLLRDSVREKFSFEGIITGNNGMKKIISLARRVAQRDVTVLLQAESGNGKELFARAIHNASHRKGMPFVAVDCASLSGSLLESELFGHVKGGFSGATRTRKGLFEEAQGGTLFLDEIGNLDVSLQSKLLRAIQEREIKPVGSNEIRKIDVRIIAASNYDLGAATTSGRFRSDLFYRLAVVTITIPPLRDRIDDIPALCEHFMNRVSGDGEPKSIDPSTMRVLMSYSWPGNVRELENAIERAVLISSGTELLLEHFPDSIRSDPTEISLVDEKENAKRKLERDAVREALRRSGGNRTEAARILKISRSSLYNRLRELDIEE